MTTPEGRAAFTTIFHVDGLHCPSSKFLGQRAGSFREALARLLVMLCGLPTMQQTSAGDGLSFDPFPFDEDGLAASEVAVSGCSRSRGIAGRRSRLRGRRAGSSFRAGCGS